MEMSLSWKELARVMDLGSRAGSICGVFRDLQFLESKMICAANVHGGKACPKKAFADTLKEDSASNFVPLG
eukprot:1139523-Pelagomonas_calceolata.AAC.1